MMKSILFFVVLAIAVCYAEEVEEAPKDDLATADSFSVAFADRYGAYSYYVPNQPPGHYYGPYPNKYPYGKYPHGWYPYRPYPPHGSYPNYPYYVSGPYPHHYYGAYSSQPSYYK